MNHLLIFHFILLVIKFVSPSRQFFNFNQTCCNGTVYDTPDQDVYNYNCCNTTLIKYPRTQLAKTPLCCDGLVYEEPEEGSSCCGSQLMPYDPNHLVCFYGEIIKTPLEICGTDDKHFQFYEPNEHVCCSGTLYEIRENYRCCGSYEYDIRNSVCCENRIVYIGVTTETYDSCCGSQPYNSNRYFCCTQTSTEPTEFPEVTGWSLFPINGSEVQYEYSCCGLKLMKTYTQVCCESGPKEAFGADSCCGEDLIYYANNDYCLNGFKRTPGHIYDCNGQFYNSSEYYCQKGQVLKIDRYPDVCYVDGEWVFYSMTKQACAINSIVDLPPELVGDVPYLLCSVIPENYYKKVIRTPNQLEQQPKTESF